MSIKDHVLDIKGWVKKNPAEFWILLAILLIGAFLRLCKIDQYMTFLGDEGRDMILIRRIFTEFHPPLIGPGTSVGSMYLGPLYYYLMAIPLLVSGFSPIGPSVAVALLGVLTILFIWLVGRAWFDETTGFIAASIYAISPTVIYYSRSSWNPNIMPFFALLCVYSIWKIWQEKRYNWLIILGISYAFVLQSHYLGLLLAPTLFLFWILAFKNSRSKIKYFLKKTVMGLGLFLLLMSPLLIFDLRHNYINSRAVYAFFTKGKGVISFSPLSAISRIPNLFNQINYSLLGGKNIILGKVLSIVLVLGLITLIVYAIKIGRKNISKINPAYILLISWISFGILGLGLYNQNIYDHYLGFLFPVPFILIGILISKLMTKINFLKILGVTLFICLVVANLLENPLRKEPNRLLQRSIHVSKVIEENSQGKAFNLAVIAETNYEDGYKYFLLKDRYPVVDIDSQKSDTITDQLFVVCELLPTTRCDPTHSAKAEVANFGWSKIDKSWEIDGAIVYKLIHSI